MYLRLFIVQCVNVNIRSTPHVQSILFGVVNFNCLNLVLSLLIELVVNVKILVVCCQSIVVSCQQELVVRDYVVYSSYYHFPVSVKSFVCQMYLLGRGISPGCRVVGVLLP